jgi:hypothetical protein
MKPFKDYLAESAHDHQFVIKFAEKPTEEQVDIIETYLKKYDLKAFTMPEKVLEDHKDFIDVPNREVFSMNVTLGMPMSPYVLLQELKLASNISEKFLVVRNATDPIEQYARQDVWNRLQDAEAKDNGMAHAARLSTDREYLPAEQPAVTNLYGDDYNQKLLTYLAGVAGERPKLSVDSPAPLFSWIKLEDIAPGEPHQDTSDFNAQFNTPKPVTKGSSERPIDSTYINSRGTMNDSSLPSVKFFKDPNTGKAKQVVLPAKKG